MKILMILRKFVAGSTHGVRRKKTDMKNAKFFILMTAAIMAGCSENTVQGELDALFGELFPEGGPGAQVLVTRHGETVYDRGFGLARLDTGAPITDTTMFNICSVSKQFSAMALFILEERGLLSLDDSVGKYFPQFRADFFKRITLRHLLSHTSGIPDLRPRTEDEWKAYTAVHPTGFSSVLDFDLFCEEEESCRYLETLDSLAFEPGTAYEYQNPTFQLVLMIVEQVTGEKFDDWMRDNVFVPAGMTGTCYFEPDRFIPNMAHGYGRDGDGAWREDDYGEAKFFGTKADGGIYTSALQFVEWDKALYGDRLVSAEMRREAHTGHVATDIPYTDYGYGWFIEHRPDRPQKIYHTGDNGGFLIFEGRFPGQDVFYLIFANQPDWDREGTVEKVDEILQRHGWI